MKYKIMFIIPSLAGGGAERVFANIVNTIDKSKFDITLVYLSDNKNVYDINDEVNEINLNSNRLRNAIFKIINVIKKKKPDLIVSTLGHMNLLLILLKPFIPKGIKIIIRQTSIASLSYSANFFKRFSQKKMFNIIKKADGIICQSEFMKIDLLKQIKVNEQKIIRIFNPVDFAEVKRKSIANVNFEFQSEYKYMLFIGRLSQVKRIPIIIEAFEKYYRYNNKVKLLIIGTGPKELELKNLTKEKGLESSIIFLGFQNNPYKWIEHCDLFLLASKNEGMPNVLIEVLALNKPVLILKHQGGTIDILEAADIKDRFVDKLIIKNKNFEIYEEETSSKIELNFSVINIVRKYEAFFIKVLKEEQK